MNRKQRRAGAKFGHPVPPSGEAATELMRGGQFFQAGRLTEAETCYQRVLSIDTDHPDALYMLGVIAMRVGRPDTAVVLIGRATTRNTKNPHYFIQHAVALQSLMRLEEALQSYDKALALKPEIAEAWNLRGCILDQLRRPDEALASFDRALSLKPDFSQALNNRGISLSKLKQYERALSSFDRALALNPDDAEVHYNRANALQEMQQSEQALSCYDRAIALRPDYQTAFVSRGSLLNTLKRFEEALADFDRALALRPDHGDALMGRLSCVNALCDWKRKGVLVSQVIARIGDNKGDVAPFVLIGCSDDPRLQLQCAKNYVANMFPSHPRPLWAGPSRPSERIRVAYLSADFRQHATAYLTTELFERHDRSRFEVIAVSFGDDDGSELRRRLVSAFDRFIDVRHMTDGAVARQLCDLKVDIAVDLKGLTQNARPGILVHRPAPIQVSYLGYPGTTGASFIDYVIADKIVAPLEHQTFFTERIVHLPGCYQVNDTKRRIAMQTPTRQQAGLPEHGFVFCCFNRNWKITPEVFDVWMRLLRDIEGSVLWLFQDHHATVQNLRNEARHRGIDPARLVFASHLPNEEYMAQYRLADLFLDTHPCNAHTTASDALWAGLPVLTRLGGTFAGRVAASLLRAVGLPELITHTLDDYEAFAVELARNPACLAGLKQRLAENRSTAPLFDTPRFTRHLEVAYEAMMERHHAGLPPDHIRIGESRQDPEPTCGT